MKKNHRNKEQQQNSLIASRIEQASTPEEIFHIIDEALDDNSIDGFRMKICYLEGIFGNFEKYYDVLTYSKNNEEHNKIIFQLICYSIIGWLKMRVQMYSHF